MAKVASNGVTRTAWSLVTRYSLPVTAKRGAVGVIASARPVLTAQAAMSVASAEAELAQAVREMPLDRLLLT